MEMKIINLQRVWFRDTLSAPNEMTEGVPGDILPAIDQGITELLDSLRHNLTALDGPKKMPEMVWY